MTESPFAGLLHALSQLPGSPELPTQALRLREAQKALDHHEGQAPDPEALDHLADRIQAAGGRHAPQLSKKELRQLPWALNRGKSKALSEGPEALSMALWLVKQGQWRSSGVYGLIESRWETKCQDGALLSQWESLILEGLASIRPSSFPPLAHWQQHGKLAFGPGSHQALMQFIRQENSLSSCHTTLCPEEVQGLRQLQHPFQQKVLKAFLDEANSPSKLNEALDFLKENLAKQRLDKSKLTYLLGPLANTMLLRHHKLQPNQVHLNLLDFCVTWFDDPRLGSSLVWNTFDAQAKQMVMGWLSHQDVELFFKAMAMDNGRAAFWLGYVHAMRFTRIAVGNRAWNEIDPQFQEEFRQGRKSGRLATLQNSNENSAIIIQFDNVTFVEFTKTGNAAYWYKNPAPFSASKKEYNIDELKVRMYVYDSDNRIIHRPGWEQSAKNLLQKQGLLAKNTPLFQAQTKTAPSRQQGHSSEWSASPPATTPSAIARAWHSLVGPSPTPKPTQPTKLPEPKSPLPAQRSTKPQSLEEVLDLALARGIPILDRRNKENSIWLLNHKETRRLVHILQEMGYRWRYESNNSSAKTLGPYYIVEARDA